MGCCISSPTGPNSPYPGGDGASASARAINAQPQPVRSPTTQTGTDDSLAGPAPVRRRRPRQPLDQHINKPLRRHEWTSLNRIWTPRTLERERTDFFDTRVTGREEVWQAIHAALHMMWESETAARAARLDQSSQTEEGGSDGPSAENLATALATAQTILTAADITLPTGDLAQGAYDLTGNYYPLPEYIVSDPLNISLVEQPSGGPHDTKADFAAGEESVDDEDFDSEEEAERRREEKGKAVANTRDQIQVRARLSEGGRDVVVSVGRCDRVRTVARHVTEEAGLPAGKRVRIAYMGKILKERSSLTNQGWKQGHVINALVFNR